MTFEPIARVYPEMAMWAALSGNWSFVISKDGDDPFMASVKIGGSKPFQGERFDLGEFPTFELAQQACEAWATKGLS